MISNELRQRYKHSTFYGTSFIGVDLDFTLRSGMNSTSLPVPKMLELIKYWISLGIKVKIITANACSPERILSIKLWLEKYDIGGLEITNKKSYGMRELWDDRAVTVVPNTGKSCCLYMRDLNHP